MKAEIKQLRQELTGKKPKSVDVEKEESDDEVSDTIKEYKMEKAK